MTPDTAPDGAQSPVEDDVVLRTLQSIITIADILRHDYARKGISADVRADLVRDLQEIDSRLTDVTALLTEFPA